MEDEVEKDEEEEAEIEKSQLMMIGIHEIYTRRNVPGKVIGPQKNLVLSDNRGPYNPLRAIIQIA